VEVVTAITDLLAEPKTTTLIGRVHELRLIEDVLAADGERSALALTGEPGVGKTAVLRAAAAMAKARGFRVVSVQGVEFEAELTYAGLHQLVLQLDPFVAALSDGQRAALDAALGTDGSASPDGLAISAAVVALLRAAGVSQRLAVFVDDLHWLDRASAKAFTFAARRAASTSAVWLTALRPTAHGVLLVTGLPTHKLSPLNESDATTVLNSFHPDLAGDLQRQVVEQAQGNPLALLELPETVVPEKRADRLVPGHHLALNDRLKATFGARFEKLPEATRRVLLEAALAGSQRLGTVDLTGQDADVLTALDAAEAERLISIDRGHMQLTFAHPLTRAAVVELSTVGEIRAAHLASAGREAIGSDRRAWHLAAAAIGPDESVAALLEETALSYLRRGDATNAVETMLRAAGLSQDEPSRNTRLLRAANIATVAGGGFDELPDILTRAHANGGPQDYLYAAAVAALSAHQRGHCDVAAAHGMLSEVIHSHAGDYDPGNAALVAAVEALMSLSTLGGPETWKTYIAIVDRFRPHPPGPTYLMRSCFADPARASDEGLRALRTAIGRLSLEAEQLTIVQVATASIFVDALAGCIQPLLSVVASGTSNAVTALAPPAMTCLGAHAFATGAWDEAQQWHQRALDLSSKHGLEISVFPQHYRLGKIAALRGDLETATRCVDEVVAYATPRHAFGPLLQARQVRALMAMSAADYESAYTEARSVSPPGEFAFGSPHAIELSFDLVEACVKTGRRDEAQAHVREMRRLGLSRLSSRCALNVAGCTALAAAKGDATTLFEIALATPDAATWPFEQARIQLAYGEHLRRTRGSAVDGRRLLTLALQTFDRLGAVPWSARAAAELRALPGARSRPAGANAGRLTPQEREIAMLAATGLTNKEIAKRVYLSDRTVSAHLYHVYPKLGITSRAALRDALTHLDDR
jgi:DNA-binding CsgD family transcriptional regulator/tetratricopeptide (TPR) repeat protein